MIAATYQQVREYETRGMYAKGVIAATYQHVREQETRGMYAKGVSLVRYVRNIPKIKSSCQN